MVLAASAALCGSALLAGAPPASALAAATASAPFLHGLDRSSTLASTISAIGDENPYAVYVAPYSAGSIRSGDILIDDFNAVDNLQGTGSSLLLVTPGGAARTFATVPRRLAGCPGGVGLTDALTELRGGWVLVGSVPTRTGTTATAGHGCLVVISATGHIAGVIAGPEIDGPWAMAAVESGPNTKVLLTNTLVGVAAPGQGAVHRGEVVRLTLSNQPGGPPTLRSALVIARGFPERSDVESRLVVGPTGIAIEGGTAYVTDPLDNAVREVPRALTRTNPAGRGEVLSSGGALRGPLGMAIAPNGDLLVTNGLNGNIVEITRSGRQVAHIIVDPDPAQSPPGNGDLFGLAVAPSGAAIYFAKDDTNTIAEVSRH